MRKCLAAAFAALLVLIFLFGCASEKPINEGMTSDGRAYRGADSPALVIYEYSDFECPYCERAQPAVEQILKAYGEKVQLQFRHFPLPIHPRAGPSAIASVCAEKQGKFWQMHDKLYANQEALADSDLEKYASEIGLDTNLYRACIISDDAGAVVASDMEDGASLGVRATPTFIIGKSMVEGSQPYDKFRQVIDTELARAG